MKLYGVHHPFKDVMEQHTALSLSPNRLVGHLMDAEYYDRYNHKNARLVKNARLRYKAAMKVIAYDPGRNLDNDILIRHAEGSYIDNTENIVISGSTGVGKSFQAFVLGH